MAALVSDPLRTEVQNLSTRKIINETGLHSVSFTDLLRETQPATHDILHYSELMNLKYADCPDC